MTASTPRVRPSKYRGRDGAIVGRNLGRAFNRPLYIANRDAFVLAGDRPALRFGMGDALLGTVQFAFRRGRRARWLHDWSDLTFEYRPAFARWVARESSLAGVSVTLDVVALQSTVGFAIRARIAGARQGDCLIWSCGGAKVWPGKPVNWHLDPYCDPPLVPLLFDPALCEGNRVRVGGDRFSVLASTQAERGLVGRCDVPASGAVRDARALEDAVRLMASRRGSRPLVAGVVDIGRHPEVHWEIEGVPRSEVSRHRPLPPSEAFSAGLSRSAALADVVIADTPEPRLNALAATISAALDGLWYPPVFRHGGMLWNVPYVGWRTCCGATAVGWHDRVLAQAKYYLSHQVEKSEATALEADAKVLHTIPAPGSRFYGRGRIIQDQGIYNMQTQFFDQLMHAWRWTGSVELERILRPGLELHLEWIRDCFDPDDDGLYESVINVWPTDSFWYAGGGGTEETAYAYRAHLTARDLARRAGDAAAEQRHERQAAKIRRAFERRLWIREKGHAALYCEADGRRRRHDDAWLYSIFLPIDAGLVDAEAAASSLRFTERCLQNDRMPAGGRRVWTSNLVPAIWSVRELWPGDNYALALAYFQAGLGEDGWDILRGTCLYAGFDNLVPGDTADRAGGTDFGDATHMFARVLVEGLFGFAPDRPHGVVRVMPQFPADWDRASVRTSDVALGWRRKAGTLTLTVELSDPAPLAIRIPLCARGLTAVTVNGRAVSWRAEAGFGRTLICVDVPATPRVVLEVVAAQAADLVPPVEHTADAGQRLVLRSPVGPITAFRDPQGALKGASLVRGVISGVVASNPGHHVIFADVNFGALPQIQRFHVEVTGAAARKAAARQVLVRAPARATWKTIDLAPVLNGDVRTIYAQPYLSPRPKTMSARIGSDGYSPWTFPYWDSRPPDIRLDAVPRLLVNDPAGCLQTPQGVPFVWPGEKRNIAFTSRWDNWPTRVTVDVGETGRSAWFLVCGSTNPMQGRIANAVLRLRYADRGEEMIELVPPYNYWNLSAIRPKVSAPMQFSRHDYTSEIDAYCVPKPWPQTVQLGENCRAMVLGHRMRAGVELRSVTLETLSPEVVVGLMGVTIEGKAG